MEDLRELYEGEYEPERPAVCFDETSKHMVGDNREPIAPQPGRVERYGYEHKCNGARRLSKFCEPKDGWRYIEVTERRTSSDFA